MLYRESIFSLKLYQQAEPVFVAGFVCQGLSPSASCTCMTLSTMSGDIGERRGLKPWMLIKHDIPSL